MAKAPADQFYYADFLRDTNELSLAATGAWIKCLCKMWFSVTRGQISMPMPGYARMFGSSVDQAKAVIDELITFGICDADTDCNANVTLTNRRMHREHVEREANRHRVSAFRERQKTNGDAGSNGNCNGDVQDSNALSSSSTSSSTAFKSIDSYVHACVDAHPAFDPRLVEIAVLETLIRRKGSLTEDRPIKSIRYFEAEIKQMCSKQGGGALDSKTIDHMLQRRREQI